MHVIANGFQITVAAALHDQGFVAAAKNMAGELVPLIQANGVRTQQPGHARDKVCVRRFDHEVEMIGHQTIGMHFKARLLAGFRQGLEEILAVHVV